MNLVFMVLPAWFLLALPSLIAGMGQLIGSSAAVQRQNRYNSPFEQIKRLRAAGLPFAAYAAGQAGNQSQLPDFSGFNMVGNAVGQGITQSNQVKMFRELLRKAGFDADIRFNEREISNEETIGALSYTFEDPFGQDVSIARGNKLLDFRIKEYGSWIAQHNARVTEIDRLIKESRFESGKLMDMAEAEYDKLIQSNKLMKQAYDTAESKNAAFQKIVDTMKGSDGELSFWQALLLQFVGAMSGGVSGGGMKLGF